jgi:hypothetical protein
MSVLISRSSSFPELSHSAILATISPGTSTKPNPAPELDAAEGIMKADSCEEKDILDRPDLPLVNCTTQANTVTILDDPPPLPTLP